MMVMIRAGLRSDLGNSVHGDGDDGFGDHFHHHSLRVVGISTLFLRANRIEGRKHEIRGAPRLLFV